MRHRLRTCSASVFLLAMLSTAPMEAQDAPPKRVTATPQHETQRVSPAPSRSARERARRFRNPGGVGRYETYYPPGMPLVLGYGRDPVRVATFNGSSGVPTYPEQLRAQQVGVMRYNAVQQSIDRYARPSYGFGFGFYGGFY